MEETEFERIEIMTKGVKKRKSDADVAQPSRKKKKYDNIMNWGKATDVEEVTEPGVRAWLIGRDDETSVRNIQDVSIPKEPKRMKQLELEFVKKVAEDWPSLSPEMVPGGVKDAKSKPRRKTLKKLATENNKLSNWVRKTPDIVEEVVVNDEDDGEHFDMEIEVERESNQPSSIVLERRLKRDDLLEPWWSVKMCREVVLDVLRDVPGTAMMN